ncbi:MAG TPA: MASE1 domain-containing protein [Solirubrobacteraceae bacterium]|nr:MASE1 domain-containing protein [Solirubrobacteraceae bacterium]
MSVTARRAVSRRPRLGIADELTAALRSGYPAKILLVVVAYYAAAHVGYAFRFTGPIAAIVWLPVGVGIAALYLLGLGLWPAVLIGDLLVNNYSALPIGSAVGQSLGNLVEVALGAYLLRRFARHHPPLESVAGFERLLLAIAAGTVVSATIGSLALYLGHVVTAASLGHLWRTWWLGDFCGALIVVPLALAWLPPPARPWFRGHLVALTMMLATIVALSTIGVQVDHTLSYLALVALVWAGLRFGVRGATLAIATGAAFTIWGATHAMGPFAFRPLNRSVLDTQLYIVVAAVSAMAVATLAREREQLAERLRESRARVVVAADDERRRLERDLHDGAQQRLTALSVHLGLAAAEAHAAPVTAAAIRGAQSELQDAIEDLRDLVHGIHPPVLRQFGLARAIEVAAARLVTPPRLLELPSVRLDETAETSAYFVVLEALNNAQRYAGASTIYVRVRLVDGALRVEVWDDGVGGAVERDELGLQGLRDRVEAIGGRFGLVSDSRVGTRIVASIPARVSA